ncbi:sugar phosphate isomerase/epimerase family protein [Paenibacillus luteus]|uniref:sugar phosphate isomerase/epimerase family protein n=1 Tax=Paenibacillus luteus TaxID=2545753 RepID=UPI0011429C2F|nr:sugar phosphate isomerase/epimerase family protein [Paenibacillus luteus]
MSQLPVQFSVFTKPWRTISVQQLVKFVKESGFDGVEFPLREGYQLEPVDAEKGLPKLASYFADHGLKIFSVASQMEERIFSACAEAGISTIRVMPDISHEEGYHQSVERLRMNLEKVIPLCEKYGVKVGIQQHYGDFITDSTGLLQLMKGLNSAYVGAVWDCAHDALAGQQPEFGLDIVWSYLCMVNLKNAFYTRTNGPEAEQAQWNRHFTSGRQGMASWERVAEYLKKRKYEGVICLTAEYTAEAEADRLIREDIRYAKSLFQN